MNKTSPDLDDGWLPIAHELLAVIACAGFSKWEMIVLREVFDQVFGFEQAKTTTAKVYPSALAKQLDTHKQSIVRAIRTLTESGVLAKVGECEYRFIKNYGSWTAGGNPRFRKEEIAYCVAAKRTNKKVKSKVLGNNSGSHQATFLLADEGVEPIKDHTVNGSAGASPTEAPALPNGSAGASVRFSPPRPPYRRARARREQGKKG